MSGWCAGNLVKLTPRERLFCMLAASLPDLDGLGVLASSQAYWDYHHKLCHNLMAGCLLSVLLAAFSSQRLKSGLLYLGLFHLHLVLDYFGSGEGWEISYLWPFSEWRVENLRAWPFYSWQNISVGFAFLGWTLLIILRLGRTPLEAIMPSLDRQLVQLMQRGRRHGTKRFSPPR